MWKFVASERGNELDTAFPRVSNDLGSPLDEAIRDSLFGSRDGCSSSSLLNVRSITALYGLLLPDDRAVLELIEASREDKGGVLMIDEGVAMASSFRVMIREESCISIKSSSSLLE